MPGLLAPAPAPAHAHLGYRLKAGGGGRRMNDPVLVATSSAFELKHHPRSAVRDTLRKARRMVDEETGIIRLLHEASLSPDAPQIFGCAALCGHPSSIGLPSETEVSGSTALSRDQAIAGAIGEATERYSAAYVPYNDVLTASFADVAEDAVPPASLVLYSADQYAREGFGYHPIEPTDRIGWVVGQSLTRNRPVLVPAFAVYQP